MLTFKKALELTRDQWRELERTGIDYKPINGMLHDCACCEYVIDSLSERRKGNNYNTLMQSNINEPSMSYDCSNKRIQCVRRCPLSKLWPDGCESPGSPYENWNEADNDEDRSMYAKEIADYCDEALRRI